MFGRLCQDSFRTNSEPEPNPCQAFFDQREILDDKFWDSLGKAYPGCECERMCVSRYSPGPVADRETIVSVVTSRSYVSHHGQVEPTLFERRMSNGISTDRKAYTTLEDYDHRAESLVAESEKKEICGSIELLVGGIRGISFDGDRAIAVYDTALKENTSHAEIACTEIPAAGTPGRKKLRATLRKRVLDACLHDGRVIPSSEIFQS